MRVNALAIAAFAVVALLGVSSSSAYADTNQAAATQPASHNVTVNAGDNLSKIAAANNTTYLRIYYANTNLNDPDLIFPNDQIRIPSADEQLTERPLPEKVKAVVAASTPAATTTKPKTTSHPV